MDKFVIKLSNNPSTSAEGPKNENQPAKKLKRSEGKSEDFQANEPK